MAGDKNEPDQTLENRIEPRFRGLEKDFEEI
jgi:hypothetical protein